MALHSYKFFEGSILKFRAEENSTRLLTTLKFLTLCVFRFDQMKHLLTLTALLISSLAMGQWPTLPYNPDENGDMLIGVADLQALLANYGNEFSSALVSEDGESALVFVGNYSYPSCAENCSVLPGHWRIASLEEIGPVYEDIVYSPSPEVLWLRAEGS